METWIAISLWVIALIFLAVFYRIEKCLKGIERKLPDSFFQPLGHRGKRASQNETDDC